MCGCWYRLQEGERRGEKRLIGPSSILTDTLLPWARSLDQQVKDAFAAGKKRSGSPRITLDLKDEGQSYNRKTVAASMQRQGLRAKAAKKFKATTNSNHDLPVAPNLLQQDFVAAVPNHKWVGDICAADQ